jgi:hypothetical protein
MLHRQVALDDQCSLDDTEDNEQQNWKDQGKLDQSLPSSPFHHPPPKPVHIHE